MPDFSALRERFLPAATSFNRKLLSDAVPLAAPNERPYPLPAFATAPASADPADGADGSLANALQQGLGLADLQASLLPASEVASGALRNESLRYFAEAWNAVIADLRTSDLMSDAELELLVFHAWCARRPPSGPNPS